MIFYLADFNGGTLSVCEYLFERYKREIRKKTIMQGGYLIVRGLVCRGGKKDELFEHLDKLFEIPKIEPKRQQTKDELINDFEKFMSLER